VQKQAVMFGDTRQETRPDQLRWSEWTAITRGSNDPVQAAANTSEYYTTKEHREVAAQLHASLISALEEGKCSVDAPTALNPQIFFAHVAILRAAFVWILWEKSSSVRGSEPRFLGRPARNVVTTSTKMSWHSRVKDVYKMFFFRSLPRQPAFR
jgi:hypothetical protein